eukprot:CAMPEP_0171117866 /NCGR_PEP_ID=MMETSP0766_2-20121228/93494_1 /TAXON_ID=439317 /ORGANISM="Gambierdiscus australes, Strain CAWD 149" /LENGTH=171 /DNA_ID=CAMNT_0011580405 /DNA_START=324 /DNA_END=836 /DNA_ORIENTATION=-
MVRQLRHLGGGGQVVSCEVDAGNAQVARAMILWAGAEEEAKVNIGRASDWLALSDRLGPVDVLILDHRGTAYHEDLAAAESSLASGARVLADNVLLPGAPLFLSYIEDQHSIAIHDVREFMRPDLDDWVVLSSPRGRASERKTWSTPREFLRWSAEIDAISWRSMHEPVDW